VTHISILPTINNAGLRDFFVGAITTNVVIIAAKSLQKELETAVHI